MVIADFTSERQLVPRSHILGLGQFEFRDHGAMIAKLPVGVCFIDPELCAGACKIRRGEEVVEMSRKVLLRGPDEVLVAMRLHVVTVRAVAGAAGRWPGT